jgi:hypothetical protein
MPDERFFHKRLGHSAKVNSLTDLEFRVWAQYQLSADDCGVIRHSPIPLQADNDSLAARSPRLISRAIDQIVTVGLLLTFIHQKQKYLCQGDWQNFQHVRYPRSTVNPCPPAEILAKCTSETRGLFRIRHGEIPEVSPENFGEVPETSPAPAGAGGREWLTANGYGSSYGNGDRAREPSAVGDPELADRAGRFVHRYAELFAEHRKGAKYHSKPSLDFPEAVGLCATWDDARLETLAIAFLTTDDKFCRNGSGSIAQFRSRASWCDVKLRESGL